MLRSRAAAAGGSLPALILYLFLIERQKASCWRQPAFPFVLRLHGMRREMRREHGNPDPTHPWGQHSLFPWDPQTQSSSSCPFPGGEGGAAAG